ncbi:hypothetical protein BGW80DRAFT_884476 [Lactifluus volemus]|nr:hypothetical protein BGW80DRAFT_884476 [Lactifluus volemus]
MAQKSSTSEAGNIGVLLVGILLNSFFCGIISKQHYLYWTSGFNDPMYMKILVAAQFSIVVFQSAMDWLFAWNLYIVIYDKGYVSKASTWGSPVNSACQCLLIIMANTFLAYRIYNLTGSRLRTGLVFGLSFTAFLIGVPVTVVGWALTERPDIEVSYTIQRVAIVLWHTLQAIAEFLIMYFLYRALRASRSGLQRSDQVVHHLARSVIQIGLFAIIWAIAGFSTYFLLPKYTFYVLLDTTSGSIYTYMIYDGLLSRPRLRGQMAERSQLELPSQDRGIKSSHPSPSTIHRK